MHGFLGGRFEEGKCIAFISAAIERSIKDASRGSALALGKLRYDVALVAKGSRGTQNSFVANGMFQNHLVSNENVCWFNFIEKSMATIS